MPAGRPKIWVHPQDEGLGPKHTFAYKSLNLWNLAKGRCQRKKRRFDLDLEEVRERMFPMVSELSGMPLFLGPPPEGRSRNLLGPSIESINGDGYYPGSWKIVSAWENYAMNEGSHEEHVECSRLMLESMGFTVTKETP